jgi:hypothetical protein
VPHAENKIFTHEAREETPGLVSFLADRFRVLPGRIAVLMDPIPDTFQGTTIYMPDGQHKGKYRPDTGTVIGSGVEGVSTGERVGVKPYDGLWLKNEDLAFIPEGRELRIYLDSDAVVFKL